MRAEFCCSLKEDYLSHPRHPLSRGKEILIDLTKMLRSRMIPGEWLREWLHHWQFFHFRWHSFRRHECCCVQEAWLWVPLSPPPTGHAPCPCISWHWCWIQRTWRCQSHWSPREHSRVRSHLTSMILLTGLTWRTERSNVIQNFQIPAFSRSHLCRPVRLHCPHGHAVLILLVLVLVEIHVVGDGAIQELVHRLEWWPWDKYSCVL